MSELEEEGFVSYDDHVIGKLLGMVGERIKVPVYFNGAHEMPDLHNPMMRYFINTFQDPHSNELVCTTATRLDFNLQDELTLIGTVKKHDDFKGRHQTWVSRCKFKKGHGLRIPKLASDLTYTVVRRVR